MKRDLPALSKCTFDLVVVGGGITGACIAHDATLRGLKVALLEKGDFGMSTSAASSKLLHGGIRYLQKLQFSKVRESAHERSVFQVIAPHLTQYVPFLIPTVHGSLMKGSLAMRAGLKLYNLICFGLNSIIKDPGKRLPKDVFFNVDKVTAMVPLLKNINGLSGAQMLYESHMHNSERMTLAFIKTAFDNGAKVANHVKVKRFLKGTGNICGVVCQDMLTGNKFEVRAVVVANSAGPFIPQLNYSVSNLRLKKQPTGFSKGVHIVTKQIESKYALALGSQKQTEGMVTRGGRHFFIIPWRGKSLIGTTNVPFKGDIDTLSVTSKDVGDFLDDINDLLPNVALTFQDVDYAFTGLYPLTSESIKPDTYQGTGEYQVVDHSVKDGVGGLISVLGAKYTTGRVAAEQAVDVIMRKLQKTDGCCKTADTPLTGGDIQELSQFIAAKKTQYHAIVDEKGVEHLIAAYGSKIDAIIEYFQRGDGFLDKLSSNRDTFVGEIHYAVDKEMACKLSDVLFARTGLCTIGYPGESVVKQVASILAGKLDWDKKKVNLEIKSIKKFYSYAEVL